jgi:hypothetical protein
MHKAKGGLIRADFEVLGESFGSVSFSGDFFCFPEEGIEWMESCLEGKSVKEARSLIESFYAEKQIESPGITVDDWLQVLSV